MNVCVYSIEMQTVGEIAMKFGTEVVLKGEGFGWVLTPYPWPPQKGVWGASGASAIHFGENFIK